MPAAMAAESLAAAPAASTTWTDGARTVVMRGAPGPRARSPCGLLLRRADHSSVAQLAVVDAEVEAALGIAAGPRLERDGSSVATVVAERQQEALAAFLAGRKLRGQVHWLSG